jgi:cytochrome c
MREVSLTCFLFVGCWGIQFTDTVEMNAWAGSPPSSKSTRAAGDAERGRAVFNGKGVCHYCHGIDGNKNHDPNSQPHSHTYPQLNPPPVDLRNPEALHLKSDKQRARAIREDHGHRHVPDTMTDQELIDTLAYLALLRHEGSLKKP